MTQDVGSLACVAEGPFQVSLQFTINYLQSSSLPGEPVTALYSILPYVVTSTPSQDRHPG